MEIWECGRLDWRNAEFQISSGSSCQAARGDDSEPGYDGDVSGRVRLSYRSLSMTVAVTGGRSLNAARREYEWVTLPGNDVQTVYWESGPKATLSPIASTRQVDSPGQVVADCQFSQGPLSRVSHITADTWCVPIF